MLASILIDDENDLDEEHVNDLMTRRDYKALNRKMNMLVPHTQVFSTSKFENMMKVHEAPVKTFRSKSKILVNEEEKLVKAKTKKIDVAIIEVKEATNAKIDVVIKEVKEIYTLLLNDNIVHISNLNNSINDLVQHYDT